MNTMNNSFGQMVREAREELGLTQEVLSQDICDVSTMSRIETGSFVPSYRVAQALMERLGFLNYAYTDFPDMGKQEFQKIKNVVLNALSTGTTERMDEYMVFLKEAASSGDTALRQFYEFANLAYKIFYLRQMNVPYARIMDVVKAHDCLKESIHQTQPGLNEQNIDAIQDQKLTHIECLELNAISVEEFYYGNRSRGVEILSNVVRSGRREDRADKHYHHRMAVLMMNLGYMEMELGFDELCEQHLNDANTRLELCGGIFCMVQEQLLRKKLYEKQGITDKVRRAESNIDALYHMLPKSHRKILPYEELTRTGHVNFFF